MDMTLLRAWTEPAHLLALATLLGGLGLWCRHTGRLRAAQVAAIFASFGVASAAAQGIVGAAEAVVTQATARAAPQREAATGLLETSRQAHEQHLAAARRVAQGTPDKLVQGFAALDPAAAAPELMAAQGAEPLSGPIVYVAVSFSMPAADLRRLARDAQAAGAVLLVRGLVRGSFRETLLKARQIFDEASLNGVGIDPNVFRAFDIREAPTFIAAAAPVEPCGPGFDCVPSAPPHDRLSGNITLEAALRRLREEGGEGAAAAEAALARLGG